MDISVYSVTQSQSSINNKMQGATWFSRWSVHTTRGRQSLLQIMTWNLLSAGMHETNNASIASSTVDKSITFTHRFRSVHDTWWCPMSDHCQLAATLRLSTCNLWLPEVVVSKCREWPEMKSRWRSWRTYFRLFFRLMLSRQASILHRNWTLDLYIFIYIYIWVVPKTFSI